MPFPSRPYSARSSLATAASFAAVVGLALLLGAPTPAGADGALDPDLLAGVAARSIGPATMSGRVGAIEAVDSDADTVYVGAASGGVWKSTDGALTWTPIFDDQHVASIGAIAVHPKAPDIVWVGTGEGNPRNSASVGWGVYKSLDGGATWTHLGLEKTEKIHCVVLHPTDLDTAWVAALGTTWGESAERGVFKTTDGGASWRKVLYVDETTGAADLVLDPENPHHLLASTWQHRRWPWFFTSGGPGSGIYESRDGGETWTKKTPEDGLPEGDLGRIGLAFAPSDADRVYALVEAEGDHNVFLASTDGGRTWSQRAQTGDQPIGNRPFYYSDIVVDPQDPERIYSLWSLVSRSIDGGRTWEVIVPFQRAHPDHHALWIDPADPSLLYLGNDGGVYVSRDRAATWRFVDNLPFSQLYHVRVDDQEPFNVFFGLQDNGSWVGPSRELRNGGIRNDNWQEIWFGDGFDALPDPQNPCCGWAMSQQGFLAYWNRETGEQRLARPEAPPGEDLLRYNWNAALAIDPFDHDVVYFGSQYVHRSTDRGRSWEVISPDLTTDNEDWQKQSESGGLTLDATGAENFVTLLAIAPSPVERGVLWTGSDDGRIHVSRDDGTTWTSVEANVDGVPAHTWIPHIEPSRHDGGEAFAVFDDHRRANWTPYIYRTGDYGATWTRIAGEGDLWGYALSIVQDPKEPEVLYAGTEFGLHVTGDGGATWHRFEAGVPTTSVMDLAIQERADSLVLGTHGRGVFIVDDLEPLRRLLADGAPEATALVAASDATQWVIGQTRGSRFPGPGEFRGANPPYGASIYLWADGDDLVHPDDAKERARKAALRAASERAASERAASEEADKADSTNESSEKSEGDGKPRPVKLTITRADAPADTEDTETDEPEPLRTLEATLHQGLNRVVWDLTADGFEMPPGQEADGFFGNPGPPVPPGDYVVTVDLGDDDESAQTITQTIEVRKDPRIAAQVADLEARFAAIQTTGDLQATVVDATRRIRSLRGDVATVVAKVGERIEEAKEADETAPETTAEDSDEDEDASPEEELQKLGKELEERLDALEKRLFGDPSQKGIDRTNPIFPGIRGAYFQMVLTWEAPPPVQLNYLERARHELTALVDELNSLIGEDVASFRRQTQELDIRLLPETEPIRMPASDEPTRDQ